MARHPWGPGTLDAVVRSTTTREAARAARVHHSTMQTRLDTFTAELGLDTLTAELGFNPADGFGRAHAGVALLARRLQRSRVLDLPAPGRPEAQSRTSSVAAGRDHGRTYERDAVLRCHQHALGSR